MPPTTTPFSPRAPWRDKWYRIIFLHDTPAGRLFDILLLIAILLSVVVVLLDSVHSLRDHFWPYLRIAEWFFTILFTVEYIARIATARDWKRYVTSFYGVVDLLAIAPMYLSLVFVTARYFTVVRSLRLLRIFRVLKLSRFMGEAVSLGAALRASLQKIVVFIYAVLTIVVIAGAVMYQIEGEAHGFTSIPAAMYWAIVTVTTVGYGDIYPQTIPGRIIASILMILGYGIIAVPTGIFSAELVKARSDALGATVCPNCNFSPHDPDASHCKKCGAVLPTSPELLVD